MDRREFLAAGAFAIPALSAVAGGEIAKSESQIENIPELKNGIRLTNFDTCESVEFPLLDLSIHRFLERDSLVISSPWLPFDNLSVGDAIRAGAYTPSISWSGEFKTSLLSGSFLAKNISRYNWNVRNIESQEQQHKIEFLMGQDPMFLFTVVLEKDDMSESVGIPAKRISFNSKSPQLEFTFEDNKANNELLERVENDPCSCRIYGYFRPTPEAGFHFTMKCKNVKYRNMVISKGLSSNYLETNFSITQPEAS